MDPLKVEASKPYEGQKFTSFDELKTFLDEYGRSNYVRFWIRSSHTIDSVRSKAARKVNPRLKYVYMKFACIYGGEKIRRRGTGQRKSTTYRNMGCPCVINATVGSDGNHVKLEYVVLEHNHALSSEDFEKIQRERKVVFGRGRSRRLPLTPEVCEEEIIVPKEEQQVLEVKSDDSQDSLDDTLEILVVQEEDQEVQGHCDSALSWTIKEPSKTRVVGENSEALECEDVCRLCLTSNCAMIPIFDSNNTMDGTLLSLKIMACASIDISLGDGLPNNICSSCQADLDIAYQFRMQCENADSCLRDQKVSTETQEGELLIKNITKVDEEGEEEVFTLSSLAGASKEVIPLDWQQALTDTDPNTTVILDTPLPEDEIKITELNDELVGPMVCPACGNHFDTACDLVVHLQDHAEDTNVLCRVCGDECDTVEQVYNHALAHNSSPEDVDNDCNDAEEEEEGENDVTPRKPARRNSSQKETNPFLCNVCGKFFKSRDRFQSHRNSHEGLRPFLCVACGKGFADRKNMHQHMDIVHLHKTNHTCPVCGKKFYTRTKMKSHLTMHYGLKPYQCETCNKSFRLKMNLVKHTKTHMNTRQYQCSKCPAGFIDKNSLKRHSYVHGGVRPFPCPICGHRFSVKFHLKKHLESKTCQEGVFFRVDQMEQQLLQENYVVCDSGEGATLLEFPTDQGNQPVEFSTA